LALVYQKAERWRGVADETKVPPRRRWGEAWMFIRLPVGLGQYFLGRYRKTREEVDLIWFIMIYVLV
jgi:hypothetical protein